MLLRVLLRHNRDYGLGTDALATVCAWNTNKIWFGHRGSCDCMLLEQERNHCLGTDALVTVFAWNTNGIMVWPRMLRRPHALGTRTKMMAWSWMLWSPYAHGTRTKLWFWHGRSGDRMLLDLGTGTKLWFVHDVLATFAFGTRMKFWFGQGCSGHRMLTEHERNYGLGMDALVTACSWNANEIMVWH